jgi:hypothetical protein
MALQAALGQNRLNLLLEIDAGLARRTLLREDGATPPAQREHDDRAAQSINSHPHLFARRSAQREGGSLEPCAYAGLP